MCLPLKPQVQLLSPLISTPLDKSRFLVQFFLFDGFFYIKKIILIAQTASLFQEKFYFLQKYYDILP